MLHTLRIHPDSVCPAVQGIDVELTRRNSILTLQYSVRGAIPELNIPDSLLPRRVDRLWQHTCCEAFFGAREREPYYEFNFSPSTEWASYRFSGYRADMSPADETDDPNIETLRSDSRLEVRASIDLARLTALSPRLRIGLSAVIEDRSGRSSYWALAHPPGKPDFHHAHGFIELEG